MDVNQATDESPIPVICVDPQTTPAYQLFNTNDWEDESKGVVQSCLTEYSILHYGVVQIAEMCRSPKDLCQPHFENLKRSWRDPAATLHKTDCYGQFADLHLLIKGFFSGIKSLLDLIVQLLSTEKVVGGRVDGFHRKRGVYGVNVLNSLERNCCASKKEVANRIKELIIEHKILWIDEVISSRDLLVHPTKGVHLLMFKLDLVIRNDELIFMDAIPPTVGGITIDRYSVARLNDAKQFVEAFLAALQPLVDRRGR